MQTEVIKLIEAAENVKKMYVRPGFTYKDECTCLLCTDTRKILTELNTAVEKVKELL